MEIDPKKLQTAIVYIQRIADGNNPINNMPAEEDSVLNNPNVIRCMYYVKEVLEEVQKNGIGTSKKKKDDRESYPLDALEKYEYKEDLTISHFMDQINALVDAGKYKKIVYKPILKWLIANGYLREELNDGKLGKIPTEKGIEIGIRAERRESMNNASYIAIVYNKTAQEFIIKNIDKMI